jgi:uncharacterized protein
VSAAEAVVPALAALAAVLDGMGPLGIAVSGGVDSMTLASFAHDRLDGRAAMFHAISPAVPREATGRVESAAAREGWLLTILDAGEFADPAYRANPADRCFYCKSSLYGAVRRRTDRPLVSGTNLDDLGEYRPGLAAARRHGVRHPYVESGIGKAGVRAIARAIGLGAIAELPAAPCLSSRVETGIAIEPATLARIHAAEQLAARALGAATVRCRVRAAGVVIELDAVGLARLDAAAKARLQAEVAGLFETVAAEIGFAPYRNGSAFLRTAR